jgi:molybdopterin-guanine dinucleotide biosynthesis protein B
VNVLALVGWSGSGKTTLLTALLPLLAARGLALSTVKHVHHDADLDQPGKDSWRHRAAGAREVLVAGGARWALLHELRDAPEPALPELLKRLAPVDLVLVEGFKAGPGAKLEVYRPALGKPPLWPDRPDILAVASDAASLGCDRTVLPLERPAEVAAWTLARLRAGALWCGSA